MLWRISARPEVPMFDWLSPERTPARRATGSGTSAALGGDDLEAVDNSLLLEQMSSGEICTEEGVGEEQAPWASWLLGGGAQSCDVGDHDWLVRIYATSGALDQAAAVALVCSATPEQLASVMVCQAPAEEAQPDVPRADLAEHRSSRARPLDWDQAPQSGHLSPESPDGQTARQTSAATLQATRDAHRAAGMTATFGEGANADYVRSAIMLAELLGRSDVATHLQGALFRVEQQAVVESLNVEDSGRYQPGDGKTFCNIYAYDVVTALGAYIPRTWWTTGTVQRIQAGAEAVSVEEYARRVAAGESVQGVIRPVYGETVSELNANALTDWMETWGASFGWEQTTDMSEAQTAANEGHVAVLLAANANSRRSGHISVILAEDEDNEAARDEEGDVRAPLQSQAGSRNFKSSNNDAGAGRDQWWENSSHVRGGAWICRGGRQGSIVTPDSLAR